MANEQDLDQTHEQNGENGKLQNPQQMAAEMAKVCPMPQKSQDGTNEDKAFQELAK